LWHLSRSLLRVRVLTRGHLLRRSLHVGVNIRVDVRWSLLVRVNIRVGSGSRLLLSLRWRAFGIVFLLKLHASELLGEFAVSSIHSGGSDIWISLDNF